MIRRKKDHMRLTIIFTLVVLGVFIITSLIMAIIAILAMHYGLVDKLGLRHTFPVLLASLPASAVVGSMVALAIGRFPLKPIREIIGATNKLAAGDFSARLNFAYTPEFRELRDSFNRMAKELNSIEMLRGDFINNFSHEFKTPIVSIKGFAELLKADDLPKQERDEYLDIIIRESTRLSTLATNVLNLSKVENQTIVADKRRYNLSEQVRRCVLLLQSSWEHRHIDFEIELEEVAVQANEEMLSQVWVNLIDNAVKFSPEGGRIVLKLQQLGNVAQLSIRDEGEGISEKDMRHIFDKFYQAEHQKSIPGNGLGLSLAQKIVQLHGGNITCQSKQGYWSEFTVHLPLDETAV